jgi:guanosine-3',5'-bis(diphosphate) 3'-pyrophosphohydrolase
VNPQEFFDKYKFYGLKIDEPMVQKAIEFAIKYYGTKKRYSGDFYYIHSLEVAKIIAKMGLGSDSIITAILHDTIRDTDLTLKEIEKHFSPEIAKLVDSITKITKIKFKQDDIYQAENFCKLFLAMSCDIRVLLIKLADCLDNMRTIDFISNPEKRKRIALETIEIYAPLADRIGMQEIKIELQDIGFRILYPEKRQSILNCFDAMQSDKENFIQLIVAEIKETISADVIEADVYGRIKTAYSTWMKMKHKDVGIDQLSDIMAFRIVVKTLEDCYWVLGMVHSVYKMIPGNFQDFISMPKVNYYQSIHTVVMGPLMQKIEIQIRTYEMHDMAEFGVAAHWRYKQGHENILECNQYDWVRGLSILGQNSTPEEFLQNTKLEMYYSQVFCFTSKGKLIALPKGATIVDFAYIAHSNISNSCVGAKVNGRIVPLRTELVNGDQVEIITSKNKNASL